MDLQLQSNRKYRIQVNVELQNLYYLLGIIAMCYQTKDNQELTIMLKANLCLYL